jgi:dephospho-CoA kinase
LSRRQFRPGGTYSGQLADRPLGYWQTVRVLMVGLTGGIGAGKSAVAARLAELGAIVVDSDVLAREVVAPGTAGLAEVVSVFGPGVLNAEGAMDRAAVARTVFADTDARRRLEEIIHPRVRAAMSEIVRTAPPGAVVVNDVPLLVESNLAANYDLVVVVAAPADLRFERLVRDRGMDTEQARARIAAQATDAERLAVADVVITNDATLRELRGRVDQVWRETIEPAARSRSDGAAPTGGGASARGGGLAADGAGAETADAEDRPQGR